MLKGGATPVSGIITNLNKGIVSMFSTLSPTARIAALLVLITPAGALAQQAPAKSLRPLSQTVQSFEARNYIVRSAEDDGRTHEVEAITPDGRRIEALVDALTGEVLTERADD